MEEMLELLVQQLRKELAKRYPSRGYNGEPKGQGTYVKNNTSDLSNSISYKIENDIDTGDPKGVIIMDDYYYYVDQGRKPGSGTIGQGNIKGWPPVRDIQQWVQQRGVSIPGLDVNTVTYLIGKSIWMKGIKGIDFINNAIDNIINDLVEEGQEEYAERFEEFIEELIVRGTSSNDLISIQ